MTGQKNESQAGSRRYVDPDLMAALYRKYSKGGGRIAGFRQKFCFMVKKYSWIAVIGSTRFFKRLLDVVAAAAMLVLLLPLFLLVGAAIKAENPGPVFYSQIRVGKWGRHFRLYKFRSMVVGADKLRQELQGRDESGGVIFKIRKDPRITRVGRVIRKLSIDELPQLWNVLRGDMSLVGPRPPLPSEVAEYRYADRRRLDVIPGITCIWQVSGRSEIDFEGQVELDVQYIESQSLWQDIKILAKTVPAVLLGRGAY